jgi:hypothetical protein
VVVLAISSHRKLRNQNKSSWFIHIIKILWHYCDCVYSPWRHDIERVDSRLTRHHFFSTAVDITARTPLTQSPLYLLTTQHNGVLRGVANDAAGASLAQGSKTNEREWMIIASCLVCFTVDVVSPVSLFQFLSQMSVVPVEFLFRPTWRNWRTARHLQPKP